MREHLAIGATGFCAGEIELSTAELASNLGVTEAAIRRSLGHRCVRRTERGGVDLAREAAVECLRAAACPATDLTAVIWLGDQIDGLRLQHELGALRAHLLCIAGECAEYLSALAVAPALAGGPSDRILVCTGESFPVRLTDTPPTEQNFRNLLSDSGSALLVSLNASPGILGFGFATKGADWKYLRTVRSYLSGDVAPAEMPFYGQVFREMLETAKTALERCLASAGIGLEQVDHFCFPSVRLPQALPSVMRMHGIPAAKLVAHPVYAHSGKSDIILDFRALAGAARPGSTALIMSSSAGVVRCVAVRF